MIRPAKCHFDGFIKPFIKGADKNHNPRKGTETRVPGAGQLSVLRDKNHNPRKGTETCDKTNTFHFFRKVDKNHNPRKGTETHTMQACWNFLPW